MRATRWSSTATERAERNEQMADRYEEGWTCQELADDFGLSCKHVWRILVDMGVEMRRRGPRINDE